MINKYEITSNFLPIGPNGKQLYQIRALRDFAYVKAGDLGGYVEGEHNLSQEDDCWIHHVARVYENAKCSKDAQVMNHSSLCGNALITDYAVMYNQSHACGNAQIREVAKVTDGIISDHAHILGHSRIVGPVIIRADGIIAQSTDYLCCGMMLNQKFATAFRCQTGYKIAMDKFVGKAKDFLKLPVGNLTEQIFFVRLCNVRFGE